jgi:hypothetical protein
MSQSQADDMFDEMREALEKCRDQLREDTRLLFECEVQEHETHAELLATSILAKIATAEAAVAVESELNQMRDA